MFIQHNQLRIGRKRSHLTQTDLAFILGLSDSVNISRWETGARIPGIETLLAYYLLFNISIESLFERQKHDLAETISKRISLRIEELKSLTPEPQLEDRINFLSSVFNRLTTHPDVL